MISKRVKIELDDLLAYLVQEVRRMLEAQGHKLTGRLINSLEPEATATSNAINAEILWEAYGRVIESGLSRDRVPYSPGSGARSSKFIEGLIRFVKLRGLRPKRGQTVKGIAFAIARSQKAGGIPTVGSKRFSRTGRRTGAIAEVLERDKAKIRLGVEAVGLALIDDFIEEAVESLVASSLVSIRI